MSVRVKFENKIAEAHAVYSNYLETMEQMMSYKARSEARAIDPTQKVNELLAISRGHLSDWFSLCEEAMNISTQINPLVEKSK